MPTGYLCNLERDCAYSRSMSCIDALRAVGIYSTSGGRGTIGFNPGVHYHQTHYSSELPAVVHFRLVAGESREGGKDGVGDPLPTQKRSVCDLRLLSGTTR